MATYTEHYGLHQWEPTDDFLRTDFNTDFGKIDAAIHGKADTSTVEDLRGAVERKVEMISGSYTGNGDRQTIQLGFQPKSVVVATSHYTAAMACPGGSNERLLVTDNGFEVSDTTSNSVTTNKKGTFYQYIVLK